MKKFFLVLAFAFFAPAVSHAFPGADVDISVGYELPKPSGSITLKDPLGNQKTFDAVNDLNLGSGKDFIARIDINHSVPILPNIYVHHLPVEVSGDAAGGHAELKLEQNDVGLYYNLPFIKEATDDALGLKLGVNARIVNLSGETKGGALGETSANFSTVIPMAYLGVDIKPIHLVSVSAEIKTLPLGSSSLTEYAAELRVHPTHMFYLGAGYFNYAVKIDPSLATGAPPTNFTLAGPYFVLGLEL
ncbi:MAG: TIGR04219 family outer membrane beta-barrel protein [Nitrospinae bacterium]|nr:TIGR04219 family outer membrane beta-barrel protein [Nitrospinota bacterium]